MEGSFIHIIRWWYPTFRKERQLTMKRLNILISEREIELLKNLIGKQLISLRHEKVKANNIVYEKVEVVSSNGRYLIDNYVDWFDDYFSGPEDIPFLGFRELNQDEDPFKAWPENSIQTEAVGETIEDVLIVQDDGDIYKNDVYYCHMKSSEGIIIHTNKAQYGFFKDNIYLDECLVIAKDANDVLSKAESLKEHYDIFGYPFSGQCKRSLISLKSGAISEIATAEETGKNEKAENR